MSGSHDPIRDYMAAEKAARRRRIRYAIMTWTLMIAAAVAVLLVTWALLIYVVTL